MTKIGQAAHVVQLKVDQWINSTWMCQKQHRKIGMGKFHYPTYSMKVSIDLMVLWYDPKQCNGIMAQNNAYQLHCLKFISVTVAINGILVDFFNIKNSIAFLNSESAFNGFFQGWRVNYVSVSAVVFTAGNKLYTFMIFMPVPSNLTNSKILPLIHLSPTVIC